MWLSTSDFRLVVHATPLISIDLVVQNTRGEILLGQRLNRPAQGSWFVPGGRVRKNETLDKAFERLTSTELGSTFARSQCNFLDLYEHFYPDSFFGEGTEASGTHYVVMAYRLRWQVPDDFVMPRTQHAEFRWWSVQEGSASDVVHPYSKAYLGSVSGE
jgi:colanic acid biosynthesis protein WcaH